MGAPAPAGSPDNPAFVPHNGPHGVAPASQSPIWQRVLRRVGPLLLFAALVAIAGWRWRDWVNADGTFYIRKAMYLRRGLWHDAISAYWSPGLSWCVAALIGRHASPTDGLHAARIVLAIFGLLYVAASGALFRRLLGPGRGTLAACATAALAYCAVPLAAFKITPDMPLGAALLAYLAIVARPDFLQRRRLAVLAGLAAGASFLCKAYALPFFAAHLVMTLAWHWWNGRAAPAESRRGVIASGAITVAVFALLAVPWIAVVSAKYHRLVFSTVMAPNHAAVGPAEVVRRHSDDFAVPHKPFFSIGENPDEIPVPDWSPFSSVRYFVHQISVIVHHSGRVALDLLATDYSGVTLLAMALADLMAIVALFRRKSIPNCAWVLATIAIYCSGFLIVAYETRYVMPMLLPLGIALCLTTWAELPKFVGGRMNRPGMIRNPIWRAIPYLILALYAAGGSIGTHEAPGTAVMVLRDYRPIYERVARYVSKLNLPPVRRIATSDVPRGNCVAYLLDRQVVGFPRQHDVRAISKLLADANIGVLVLWETPGPRRAQDPRQRLAISFVRKAHWVRRRRVVLSDSMMVELYVPPVARPAPASREAK